MDERNNDKCKDVCGKKENKGIRKIEEGVKKICEGLHAIKHGKICEGIRLIECGLTLICEGLKELEREDRKECKFEFKCDNDHDCKRW